MKTATALLFSALLWCLAAGVILWARPHLPPKLPIHWNMRGEIDGWASTGTALAGGLLVLALATLLIPLSARLSAPAEARLRLNAVSILLQGLFVFILALTLFTALRPQFEVFRTLLVGMFLFFAALGPAMRGLPRNRWMGVRTPWSLASDAVWQRTHEAAAKIFLIGGLLGAALAALGALPIFVFLWLLAMVFWPCALSYSYSKSADSMQS